MLFVASWESFKKPLMYAKQSSGSGECTASFKNASMKTAENIKLSRELAKDVRRRENMNLYRTGVIRYRIMICVTKRL